MKDQIENVLEGLKNKIISSNGIEVFVRNRSKFEDWIKVELVNLLVGFEQDIVPEKDEVDIQSLNYAIEIKVAVTNYEKELLPTSKSKSITDSINGVLRDANKLRNIQKNTKLIILIVFPLSVSEPLWQHHLQKIHNEIGIEDILVQFVTTNRLPIAIYVFKIQ